MTMPTSIPPYMRRAAYLFFILTGLGLASLFIVFGVYGQRPPLWFVAALAVYAFLSPYGHSIALGNVPSMDSVSLPTSLLGTLGIPSTATQLVNLAKSLTASAPAPAPVQPPAAPVAAPVDTTPAPIVAPSTTEASAPGGA